MEIEWKDVTSFSQGDTEKKPTTYSAQSGQLKITITCGHIHYRGEWVMHCRELGLDTKHIPKAKTLLEAKQIAIELTQAKAAKLKNDADGFCQP